MSIRNRIFVCALRNQIKGNKTGKICIESDIENVRMIAVTLLLLLS